MNQKPNLDVCIKCQHASGFRINDDPDYEQIKCGLGVIEKGYIYSYPFLSSAIKGKIGSRAPVIAVRCYSMALPPSDLNLPALIFNEGEFPMPPDCPYVLEHTLLDQTL